jgi:hypothetical protein
VTDVPQSPTIDLTGRGLTAAAKAYRRRLRAVPIERHHAQESASALVESTPSRSLRVLRNDGSRTHD